MTRAGTIHLGPAVRLSLAVSIATAIRMFLTAPAAMAQTPPTNLRVGNFEYAAKVHRFTFEWDPATAFTIVTLG